MNIIVAADNNWAIGRNGNLLVRIPNDQKILRQTTAGKVVVYGRKTLESFSQAQPLQGRVNIVLSRNPNYKAKGALVLHSLDELLEELKQYDSRDVYIIGGQSVYQQLLPYCDTVHVTKIDYAYQADAYFANLDESSEWQLTADSEEQTYFDLEYTFLKYEKKS